MLKLLPPPLLLVLPHQPRSSELPRPLLEKLVLSFLLECGLVASIWILGIWVT